MLWLKCCPRCNTGALYEGSDIYGSYVACLQCGYYLTQAEEVALRYASRCRLKSPAHPEENRKAEPVLAGDSR